MNQSWTFRILDFIHTIRSMIAVTNIFVWILEFEIQNYFAIQLQIRYWQSANEICCDGMKCNLSVVIFGDFLFAYFYELILSIFWTKILEFFVESIQHEILQKKFTNHPLSIRTPHAWSKLCIKSIVKNPHYKKCMVDEKNWMKFVHRLESGRKGS